MSTSGSRIPEKKKKKGLERTSAELDWIEWTVPGVLLKVIMSEQHIINATVLMSEMHPPFHSSVKDNPFYLYITLYARLRSPTTGPSRECLLEEECPFYPIKFCT